MLELLEDRLAPATIKVAVVTDGSATTTGFTDLVNELNADSLFSFSATLLNQSDIATAAALNGYNVVVVGGSGTGPSPGYADTFAAALHSWVQAGGGLIMTGWGLYANEADSAAAQADINAILPVQLDPANNAVSPAPMTVSSNGTAHPVTAGIVSFTDNSNFIEYSAVGLAGGATSLATASGKDVVVVRQPGLGRAVYLGELFTADPAANNNGLRTGTADQLLQQAVAWASHVPIYVAVVSDTVQNSGYTALVDQLNGDTLFQFSATLVNPADVATTAQLNAYNAVVVGGSGFTSNGGYDTYAAALSSWAQGGGGLVMTGWGGFANTGDSGATVTDMNAILPITVGSGSIALPGSQLIVPNATVHPVTAGIASFTDNSNNIEIPNAGLNSGATALATTLSHDVVVVRQPGSGRTVYLGEVFTGDTGIYNNGGLRAGMADQLLQQAVAWSADRLFLVTNTNDSGAGSLRQAILDANAAGTGAVIGFTSGATGAPISVTSALPALTAPDVTMDATSTEFGLGYSGTPLVVLDGSLAGSGVNGLTISGGSATVRGLDIIHFHGNGILLTGKGNDNIIQSNYIGVKTNGVTAAANTNDGILISGDSQDTIGGTTTDLANIISGNTKVGIEIDGGGAAANQDVIEGNFIGTDTTGTAAVPNGQGILLVGASGNFIGSILPGSGNLISGNTGRGIVLTAQAGETTSGNLIQGNFIGTQEDGVSPLGNGLQGIYITNGASGNEIGSVLSSGANTIAFNNGAGVLVGADAVNPPVFPPTPDSPAGANNVIIGNSIAHTGGIVLNDFGNNLQAAPVIGNVTPAASGGGTTTINFTLGNTINLANYRIEFFANDANNPEGKTFLGAVVVIGNGGTLSPPPFTSTDPAAADPSFITATATSNVDDFGNPGPSSNTSQFSSPASRFSDDFNRGGTDLGTPWQIPPLLNALRFHYRRPMGFSGFQLQGSPAQGAAVSVDTSFNAEQVSGLPLLNPTLTADVDASNSQSKAVGLIARIQGNDDAYVGVLTHTGVAEIWLFHGTTNMYTPLDSEAVPGNPNVATLQFVVNGPVLKLFVNGALAAHASDPTLTGSGGVGLFAWGTNGVVDNFSLNGV
jgi:uncharacterized membrane protein